MSLETPEKPTSQFRIRKEYIIAGVVLILALIPSVYFYSQYRIAQSKLNNPTQFAGDEAKRLVASVGKLMSLPSDETPTVATVNDREKLKNQPFFAKSENGDKVLIYTNAKKAILYRPSINKIIDVAPVNIGAPATATDSAKPAGVTPSVAQVTVQLLNGTSVVGLTKKYETEHLAGLQNVKVVDRDNARKRNYETTVLVNVTGKKSASAETLSKTLGIPLSPLPEGEATPSADFLIILGADKK